VAEHDQIEVATFEQQLDQPIHSVVALIAAALDAARFDSEGNICAWLWGTDAPGCAEQFSQHAHVRTAPHVGDAEFFSKDEVCEVGARPEESQDGWQRHAGHGVEGWTRLSRLHLIDNATSPDQVSARRLPAGQPLPVVDGQAPAEGQADRSQRL
jgi:hypothetical protein